MYICTENGTHLSQECPKCHHKKSYKISANIINSKLTIFTLCATCNYKENIPEPKINKKNVYLDQHGIRQFALINKQKNFDERFLPLYSKIKSLTKKQLIICPTSTFHQTETSYLSDQSERQATQKISEQLACGTKFKDPDSIIKEELLNIIDNNSFISADKIFEGELNCWYLPKFEISLPLIYQNGKFRELGINNISNHLKTQRKSQKNILDELVNDYERDIIKSPITGFNFIIKLFEEKKYSLKDHLKTLPTFNIMAAICIELSNDFSNGRKKNIDRGMALDIYMAAHTIPYVDAIFLDQEMHTLLDKNKHIPDNLKKRIYSLKGIGKKRNIEDFIKFLDEIENNYPKYSYPPFEFNHNQIIEAIDRKKNEQNKMKLFLTLKPFMLKENHKKIIKLKQSSENHIANLTEKVKKDGLNQKKLEEITNYFKNLISSEEIYNSEFKNNVKTSLKINLKDKDYDDIIIEHIKLKILDQELAFNEKASKS